MFPYRRSSTGNNAMDSTTTVRSTQAPPWAVSVLTPMIAIKVAVQLLNDHPNWTRNEVAEYLHAHLKQQPDPSAQGFIDEVLDRWPTQESVTPDNSTTPDTIGWRSLSVWILTAANLIPLYGVFVFGWSVFPILLLYWIENVINGLSVVARMLCADPADPATWAGKAFMVPLQWFTPCCCSASLLRVPFPRCMAAYFLSHRGCMP